MRNDIFEIPQPKPKFRKAAKLSQNTMNFTCFKLLIVKISSGIPQNAECVRNDQVNFRRTLEHSAYDGIPHKNDNHELYPKL